jgi:beta-glucuronidase
VRSGLRLLGTAPWAGGGTRLTINGEAVKLKGFNRHHQWPDTGAAVTPAQEARDLDVVKGVNANYIRGGHYPQSQSWLDLLDESGIALWEEALGPGVATADILDPRFMAAQVEAVTSMVQTSANHPSLIFHGFFNEGPSSDKAACVGYQALADTVHSLVQRSWRMVTWASDKTTSDVCLAAADVVSFNSYPGWYSQPGNISSAAPFWKAHVDWAVAQFPAKPFTVSETGGGGIYELVNDTLPDPGPFWSTHYQRLLLAADASYLLGDARVTGLSLWLLHDFKVDDESCGQCSYLPHPDNLTVPWTCGFIRTDCGRPNGVNHKGVVDWWRRPKESFFTMQQIYAA